MRIMRSEVARWALAFLAVLVLGAVGMRTPGPESSVMGRVAGFGFKLSGDSCYLTVAYVVDGKDYRFRTPSEERWCGYSRRTMRSNGTLPVLVHYDSSDPARSTLTPRGPGPVVMISLGLAGLVACVVGAKRGRGRNTHLPAALEEPGTRALPRG